MTASLLNVYAHIPAVNDSGQYRLGAGLEIDPDNDLYMNTTLDDGTIITVGEPDGWEGIEFITPIDTVGGRDGGLVGPQSVAPRTLDITGLMVCPSAQILRTRIRQMRAMLGPRLSVVWDQYDFGLQVRMGLVCRSVGKFSATPMMGHQQGGVATVFTFSLVAANPPWKYGTGSPISVCTGLPASTVSGRTYNKTYPWNYGAFVNPGGQLSAENDGDIEAWPVFTFTGLVDNPVVSNDTTGDSFILTSTLAAGQSVTVDSRTGIVSPSGYRLVGRPFPLVPGVNTIRWRASSGNYDPSAQLCLTWRNTWE